MLPLVVLVTCAATVAASPGLAQAEPSTSDVDRQIAAASARLETLVERHNAVRADLAATHARADATNAHIAELAGGLRAAQERVGAIAAWAYKSGPASQLSGVLQAGSAGGFIERMSTIETLARADQREITGLAALTGQLDQDRATLARLEARQAQQEAEVGALRAQVERDLAGLRALRTRIGPTSRRAPTSATAPSAAPSTSPPSVSGAAGRAVAFAYAQLGKPYVFGADGPGSYDCSGLTSAAWRTAGVVLPHSAARQYSATVHVSRAQLQPGDLVFYYGDIHHVAIYVGSGNVIHAPNADETVRVQGMDLAPVHGYGRPA